MIEKRNFIGRDDDDGGAWLGILIGVLIVICIVICAIIIMCTIGAIIGAFHAIKNYLISLKVNLIDSNRHPRTT